MKSVMTIETMPPSTVYKQFKQQNAGHHFLQIVARDTADEQQERAFHLKEHAHVENAADRNQHARQEAQVPAVASLKEFRHGHDAHGAHFLYEKSGAPDEDHHKAGDQAVDERRESGLEAELRRST